MMTEISTQVAHHCPTAPIYLVGTKSDLRSGSGPVKLIPPHQGQSLAKEVSTAHENWFLVAVFDL